MTANILLINPKFPHNVGQTVRAASCYQATEVLFTDERVNEPLLEGLDRLPREERMKGYAEVRWSPIPAHRPVDYALRAAKRKGIDLTPVAIELLPGSEPLPYFEHPDHALYVFGPEDGSIPAGIRNVCHRFVQIPSMHCLNLSAAVYVTLYDRTVKRAAAGLQTLPNIDAESRGVWHTPAMEALS